MVTEAVAFTETGVISQVTYCSDICQVVGQFMRGILKTSLPAPLTSPSPTHNHPQQHALTTHTCIFPMPFSKRVQR